MFCPEVGGKVSAERRVLVAEQVPAFLKRGGLTRDRLQVRVRYRTSQKGRLLPYLNPLVLE